VLMSKFMVWYQYSIKGIVSLDFGVFFISLFRYEVCNRTGSSLFLILMTFSYLNFQKSSHSKYRGFGVSGFGIVTVWIIFRAS
jgi:hypothetical protein